MFPKLTLILGGASSGKSAWAEGFVDLAGKPPVYLATARALDAEMRAKIERHRQSRGEDWRTVEEPLDAVRALFDVTGEECVLFDCATLWLTNHLLEGSDLEAERDALIDALRRCAPNVVVVSNEVGHGIVPEAALSRRFRDAQGVLNTQLAAASDLVIFITAGLPMVLKGRLPELPA